jgi:hypothetical protein
MPRILLIKLFDCFTAIQCMTVNGESGGVRGHSPYIVCSLYLGCLREITKRSRRQENRSPDLDYN